MVGLSNVLFLNTLYTPSRDEYRHTSFLQAELSNFYFRLNKDCKTGFEKACRKQQMHNLLRSKICIVEENIKS